MLQAVSLEIISEQLDLDEAVAGATFMAAVHVPGGMIRSYVLFVIFGVLFATNVFVGVVIDEFNRIRRVYDGSAALTEEQVKSLLLDLLYLPHLPYSPDLSYLLYLHGLL